MAYNLAHALTRGSTKITFFRLMLTLYRFLRGDSVILVLLS